MDGETILIVDAAPSITRSLARMLDLMGYRAKIADSGEAALDLLEQTNFDLVLMDLQMPVMDGLEVLTAARALAQDTTFVILTARGSFDSAVEAMRRGASDYLLKPCAVDEIVTTIQRALDRRRRAT